jgi:pseudouridine synthase
MRINQFIAGSTGLSRRAADTKITGGRVTVNGQVATVGMNVEPKDTITLDDTVLNLRTTHTYVLLNKPEGYVSSRVQQDDAPTLYDLLPENFHTLRIAGRLDRDSSGLILLTDDGNFIQKLIHPSAEKTKRYELQLDHPISESDVAKIEAGVPLKDGISHVTVRSVRATIVVVSLAEGRNRQLRRTFGALGYAITRLHRTSLGPFEVKGLAPGAWMETDISGARR